MVAVAVTVGIVTLEFITYGPDIDGNSPALADEISGIAIESVIVTAFALSAFALFRWHKVGWWSSFSLDGLLSLAVISMIIGDFKDRYLVIQEGREAFRGDLLIHGMVLLMCVGATGFLLLARKQFFKNPEPPRV
ncbi:MAG: hypothetical protein ACRYFU_03175 [Janthinobacterium lividum]